MDQKYILNNRITRFLFAGWGLKAAVLQVFLPSWTLLSTNYCKKKVEFVVVGCEWIWWGALLSIYQWAPFVATQFFCALTSIGLSPYCCVRTPLLESVHSLWVSNTSRKKWKLGCSLSKEEIMFLQEEAIPTFSTQLLFDIFNECIFPAWIWQLPGCSQAVKLHPLGHWHWHWICHWRLPSFQSSVSLSLSLFYFHFQFYYHFCKLSK